MAMVNINNFDIHMKSAYNFWLNKLNKVFSIRKMEMFFGIIVFFIIAAFLIMSIMTNKENKEFYNIRLVGTVRKIDLRDNGFYYKIDLDWYLIKHPIVSQIALGDSIIKEPKSYHILIKNNYEIKWNKSVRKNIVFSQATPD